MSLADIAADVAVCLEFWNDGRLAFFTVSIGIFCLAQACYSFLFVVAFGAHLSNARKFSCFLIAMPFSQLVPVFTLLESLHLDCISKCLTRVGLKPTRDFSSLPTSR